MIQDKIMANQSYPVTTYYWTPLDNDNDNEQEEAEEEINAIKSATVKTKQKENKWTRQIARQREQRIITDSGATSHFMSEEMNLPKGDKSHKEVYLPDDTKLTTSTKTQLPFTQLSDGAREADILPGLKRSLISVNKMSKEGYTTIFHPGDEGVTIHEEDTVTITMTAPPVLYGIKTNGEKLWTITSKHDKSKQEETHNVYSLPSMAQ